MKTMAFRFWCSDKGRETKNYAFEVALTRSQEFALVSFSDLVEEAAQRACEQGLHSDNPSSEFKVYVVDELDREWEVNVAVYYSRVYSGHVDSRRRVDDMTVAEVDAWRVAAQKKG